MRKSILTLALLAVCLLANAQENKYEKYFQNLPFKMQAFNEPQFPKNEVNLKDYGAVGDGQTLCTEAFAKAIDALSKKGGGRLLIPEGVWFTGPIVLKSNIDLHVKEGAIIFFSPDEKLYPIVETSFEGLDTRRTQSPISARNAVNIAITGRGVIDGNGRWWRPLKKQKVTEAQWKDMTSGGGIFKRDDLWYPSESYLEGEKTAKMNVPQGDFTEEQWLSIRKFLRPVMISLVNCKNVLLKDLVFQNSPAWNIHPLMCENLIVDNILAKNPSYAQNGDAIDVESCKNVLIVNSKFDAGDDGICVKSGKDADGRRRGRPTENMIVDGCTVFAGHGGFVVGSEMSGGVRNILVKHCQFLGTDVGLRFKSTRGRGGIVENIFVDDVSMTDILTDAITFNMYYGGKSVAEMLADGDNPDNSTKMPVTEETPIFRHIDIRNVVCNGAGRAMEFNGLPEMPIEDITLENVQIIAKKDAVFTNYKDVKKKNVNIVLR
jgi:polygalacturonase